MMDKIPCPASLTPTLSADTPQMQLYTPAQGVPLAGTSPLPHLPAHHLDPWPPSLPTPESPVPLSQPVGWVKTLLTSLLGPGVPPVCPPLCPLLGPGCHHYFCLLDPKEP